METWISRSDFVAFLSYFDNRLYEQHVLRHVAVVRLRSVLRHVVGVNDCMLVVRSFALTEYSHGCKIFSN